MYKDKLFQEFNYEKKDKDFIISKINKITNNSKNGCKIYVDDNKINIKANNKNTILYAYELIKKELSSRNNNNIKKQIKEDIDNEISFRNKYDLLETDTIVEHIINNKEEKINNNLNNNFQNKILKCNIYDLEKKDKIYEILNNDKLSEEEKKSNKIALELLEEENRLNKKKIKNKNNKLRRKEKLRNKFN